VCSYVSLDDIFDHISLLDWTHHYFMVNNLNADNFATILTSNSNYEYNLFSPYICINVFVIAAYQNHGSGDQSGV